ncbi:MAG: AmmeMemoRadiSam system radical SAM enzyme [Candidatus Micrarchaeota archaeon]|nr:AmmeMemoRadiSam system radical SAM enzyme [Candidatus Micrarchaeota archaeon]
MATKEAMFYNIIKNTPINNLLRCRLCSHYCVIAPGKEGLCLVRKNIDGKLYSLNWAKAVSLNIDPIEKKPFFHFKPGTRVLSFGTPGCNFRCLNCQNWDLSQGVREHGKTALDIIEDIEPKEIVKIAIEYKADGFAYTYSEPTIFFEYAYDTIVQARKNKLSAAKFHTFVSNGYFSKELLDFIIEQKLLEAIRIDLKFIEDEKYYRVCGGRLKPVLENIKKVYKSGIHLELINLVIPKENDQEFEIEKLAKTVYEISPEIPLHFSRFFPYYKLADREPTPLKTLEKAKKIALEIGLKYVYIGNTSLEGAEDTYCPECNLLLIKRNRFFIEKNVFEKTKEPICPNCSYKINIVL